MNGTKYAFYKRVRISTVTLSILIAAVAQTKQEGIIRVQIILLA